MRTPSYAFFFIILLIICTYTFNKMLRMFPRSTMLNYVVCISTQLKWAWDYLLMQSFCQVPYKFNIVTGMLPEHAASELGVRIFEGEAEAAEPVECAVCLCKIEEGEEIRDLRCDHIFHSVCLDRWLRTGRMTCPLCRNHLKPAGRLLNDLHQEVVVFDFFSDRRHRCTWWLR